MENKNRTPLFFTEFILPYKFDLNTTFRAYLIFLHNIQESPVNDTVSNRLQGILICLADYLLKIRRPVFADGANKAFRQFLALVYIAAYCTTPDDFSLGTRCRRSGFDVFLIVAVGGRAYIR